jgi:hypothetical protein
MHIYSCKAIQYTPYFFEHLDLKVDEVIIVTSLLMDMNWSL